VILVDTSVWIEHLRRGVRDLAAALETGAVVMHPFVMGELACGHLHNRAIVLDLFARLPEAPVATHAESLRFIEAHALAGRGVGYIDVHLLAAVALAPGTRLWTRDRQLARVAESLDLAI
jgi:predicted nucleic acid-binding protein